MRTRSSLLIIGCLSLFFAGRARAQGEPAAPPAAFAPVAAKGMGFGSQGQIAISGELRLHLQDDYVLVQPALDYFIVQSVSVGGLLGAEFRGDDETSLTIGLRAGYNLNITERFSFWPTVGVYVNRWSNRTDSNVTSRLGIYAPFLFHIVPHLFVGLGPFFNLPLGEGDDSIGITSVVGGWF
jgi:hypothetical protein